MRKLVVTVLVCTAILVVGVGATVGIVSMRSRPDEPQAADARVVNVSVQVLAESVVEDSFTLTGSLEPWKEVLLSAETSGPIEWQGVSEGDVVRKGQDLIKVNQVSKSIRLERVKAEHGLAMHELNRVRKLQSEGIDSPQNLDRILADSAVAVANLRSAEVELAACVVKAPFDGVVDVVHQEQDEFVGVGTPLISLMQVNKLKMVVGIADQDVSNFALGDPVIVQVDAYRGRVFSGIIHRIAGRAERSTHTFETEVELENPGGLLKPGMIARALLVRERYPNSITIPVFSMITEGDARYVFVERDGVAERRAVTVGFYKGNFVQIADGLEAGDRLIISGHRGLRDGSRVDVRETKS